MAEDKRLHPSPVEDKRVFVVGGDKMVKSLFEYYGANCINNVKNADIVVFTGGEDVSPELYGQKALDCTHSNLDRDKYEVLMYKLAGNKFKIGICRGAQFLNVMNGGSLWQDVDNHAIANCHHISYVQRSGTVSKIPVSSTHHQQMRLPAIGKGYARGFAWGWCGLSTRQEDDTEVRHVDISGINPLGHDLEIVCYPNTRCLCFQPHPELPGLQFFRTRNIFMDCIERLETVCAV